MSDIPSDLKEKASDPKTALKDLQHIAQNYPSLRPQVALNPATYPALLKWLSDLEDPQVDRALAKRKEGWRYGKAASVKTETNGAPVRKSITNTTHNLQKGAIQKTISGKSDLKWRKTAELDTEAVDRATARSLQDQADLKDYQDRMDQAPSRRRLWISLFIAILLVLLLTVGGNLADLLTGGDGKNGWFGSRGVISRILHRSDLTSDRNNNGIPDAEEKGQSKSGSSGGDNEDAEQKSKTSDLSLDMKSEDREIAPAPVEQGPKVKPYPPNSFQVADFVVDDGNIHCTIAGVLTCDVAKYRGNIGQLPGNGIRFVLTDSGAAQPQDIGITQPGSSNYALASGASVASGNYACTSTGNGVDCWNLQTGRGLLLSADRAQAYRPDEPEPPTP